LPVDSKFPLESYQSLLTAWKENIVIIDAAQKLLLKAIESFAKDISGKYIDPPHTTDLPSCFFRLKACTQKYLRHPELFERLPKNPPYHDYRPDYLVGIAEQFKHGL